MDGDLGQREERLDYIQSMLRQLGKLAESDGHGMLAYFVEMAYLEANHMMRTIGAVKEPGEQSKRRRLNDVRGVPQVPVRR